MRTSSVNSLNTRRPIYGGWKALAAEENDNMHALLLFHGATAPSGPGSPHYRGFMITLRHTTLGRTPLDE